MKPTLFRFVVQLVALILLFDRCANKDINELQPKVDCTTSDLEVKVASTTNSSNCKAIDGKVVVNASGGMAPYDFNINGGVYQTSGEFLNLSQGTYTVRVKDAGNCTKSIDVVITAPNSNLDATSVLVADGQCLSDDGSATINATGGETPYTYQIDAKGFGSSNVFTGLKSGQHSIIVKDKNDCQKVLSIEIPRKETGISYKDVISPIFLANCASSGCHGANSINGDWTNYNAVKNKAALIKTRTGNRSMPIGGNSLTQQQIDQIACWVDDGAINN